MVRECHQSKYVNVEHIPDIINTSNIFAEEMKDNTHLRNIRDSMMVSLQAFIKYYHHVTSHIISVDKLLTYYSIQSEQIVQANLKLQ